MDQHVVARGAQPDIRLTLHSVASPASLVGRDGPMGATADGEDVRSGRRFPGHAVHDPANPDPVGGHPVSVGPHHAVADPSSAFRTRLGGLSQSRVGEGKAALHERTLHFTALDSRRGRDELAGAKGLAQGGVLELASVQIADQGAAIHPGWNLLYDGLGHKETVVPRDLSVQPRVPPREIQVGRATSAGVGAPHFEVKVELEVGHMGSNVSLDQVKREVEDSVQRGVKKAGDRFMAGLGSRS